MAKHYDEAEKRYIEAQGRFDETTSAFLARELTHIRAQVLQVKKAPLNAFSVFPVQTDIPEGAESALLRIFDEVGMAEIISNYADDLPRADVLAKETAVKVYTAGAAYGFNEVEIKNAAFAGRSLSALKAQAARMSIDRKLNHLAWFGDKVNGIVGFLANPNIGEYTIPANAKGTTLIKDMTEDEVLATFNAFLDFIPDKTNDVEKPNTVLLPPAAYAHLATTRLSQTETTLLRFLQQVHPEITRWMKVGELRAAGAGGKDMMIAGYFDPTYIKLEIPNRFQQIPVDRRNLEYVVDCISRCVGVTVSIPFAFVKAVGC